MTHEEDDAQLLIKVQMYLGSSLQLFQFTRSLAAGFHQPLIPDFSEPFGDAPMVEAKEHEPRPRRVLDLEAQFAFFRSQHRHPVNAAVHALLSWPILFTNLLVLHFLPLSWPLDPALALARGLRRRRPPRGRARGAPLPRRLGRQPRPRRAPRVRALVEGRPRHTALLLDMAFPRPRPI
jgi:hypothetical protein